MKGSVYSSIIGVVFILIYSISVSYVYASWSPEIVPPESGSHRGSAEPIRLNFPPDVPEDTYSRLALELDAIDISAVVVFEGSQLVFQPPQPLEFGIHELRLVEYLEDGSIEEIGLWTFEVRQSSAFRKARFALNSQINAYNRIAEDYLSGVETGDDSGIQGGMNLQFSGENENFSTNFYSNYIYDTQDRNTARGEEFDLGEYLLELNFTEHANVKLGHHSINHTSLINDGFYRRGVSGALNLPFMNSRIQGFSMRTGDIVGFVNGLGVTDSDNRVNGVVLDYQPISNNPQALTLTVSYLDGEGIQNGTNIGGVSESNAGDASSIAADSLLFDQTVRLRGEYSESNFDFDGEGQGFSKEKDNAYNYLITYSPKPSYEVENPFSWNFGAEKLVVGPDFRSLANTTLINDRDMTRVFGGVNQGSLSAEASFAYEEDNLDNDFNATNITRYGYLTARYNQYEPYPDSSKWHWLGIPSYDLTYSFIGQSQKSIEFDLLTGLPLPKTDNTQHDIGLRGQFSYSFWNWYTGLGWAEFQDHSDQTSDSETVRFDLGANFNIGTRFSIGPNIQINSTHERDTRFDTTTIIYGLNMSGIIIQDKLFGNFTLNVNDFDNENDPLLSKESTTLNVSGDVTWNLIAADGIRPRIDLRLTGSYQDVDDDVNVLLDEDQYQIFLSLDVGLGIEKPATFY